jgi:hypothetical protein
MNLIVISAAYEKPIHLRGLIDSFILQTDPRWLFHCIHDGQASEEMRSIISLYDDERIDFIETKQRTGLWGHLNRRWALEQLISNSEDYVLITNDDNYYVPRFVEFFLEQCDLDVGIVYCDIVHSYLNYDIMKSEVKASYIDSGAFIVRLDVAKKVGFLHVHEQADGRYAERCAAECIQQELKIVYIQKPLFIHN